MTGPLSPMQRTVATATDYWNDSCGVEDLRYAIEHGAVGATSNPTIVLQVLRREWAAWEGRIRALIDEHTEWSDQQLTWKVIEEMAVRGAELLQPVFEREGGRKGRLSLQTDPTLYRNAAAIVEQAERFATLAPNIQVKIPATRAGLVAIERATAAGVNINATVCFTVPQALAVAEAVERGLNQRAKSGQATESMTPVCTIMVGRIDDWLKIVAKNRRIALTPGQLDWAGIACIKRAHALYRERGYRTRLLAAAYRHHLHWSELIGGDVILTMPCAWARLFNGSDIEVVERFDRPVDPAIIARLSDKLEDFRRAYEPDGMDVAAFDDFGATRRTLRGFIASYYELVGVVRDLMLPDPDIE